jgi:nucleotide-binding universal stress UspA family protein
MNDTGRFRILLPMAPEEPCGESLALLAALFPPAETHVRRLYVSRPLQSEAFVPEMYADFEEIARIDREARLAANDLARRNSEALERAGFAVETDVAEGHPIAEIVREMGAWKADLTAIRASRPGTREGRLGQLTSVLLRQATTPLLIHRGVPGDWRVRRILIATDFSEASRSAADWGMAIAAAAGAEAHLLYVLARHGTRHLDSGVLLKAGTDEIARWRTHLTPGFGIPVTDAHVLSSEFPAEGILNFSRDSNFDLIALAGTGRSRMAGLLLGSNARTVVRDADRPVLLVPAQNRVAAAAAMMKLRALAPAAR